MSQHNHHSIANLPNYIKAARELSILGGYQKSLGIYKKIFHIIDEHIPEIESDNNIKEEWDKTKEKLKIECSYILRAYQNCRIFQTDIIDEEKKKKEEEIYNNNILMRDNRRIIKNESSKVNENSKRWEHFGGQPPFSYLRKNSDNSDFKKLTLSTNNTNYTNNDNYVVEKNNSHTYTYSSENYNNQRYMNKNNNKDVNYLNDFYNDPDVWTSPDEDPSFSYQKSNSIQNKNEPTLKKRKSCQNLADKNFGVIDEKKLEQRRQNYERPWAVPLTSKPKSGKVNNNQKNNKKGHNNKDEKKLPQGPPKSPFLLARYPEDDGNGPDTELIQMIEREVVDMNPNVSFDDIAELDVAKRALTEAVILPLLMPDFFVGLRRPWKGVLLYGPSGTGKTLLAKALATQGKTTFFNVSPTTFASKWKGESEKMVRILFEMARFYAPSTIFIDEVDSVGIKRTDKENEASRKELAEMLVQMDGISEMNTENENLKEGEKPKFVMVLGATNLPWDLDDALRRRFEKRIYIPLPNPEGRRQMFEINFKGINLSNDINMKELVEKTKGYSGHDISSVCREASLMNMRRKLKTNNGKFDIMEAAQNKNFLQGLEAPVSQNDILLAIKNISKSVSYNDMKKFDEWTKLYSST